MKSFVVSIVRIVRELYRFVGFDWFISVDKWIFVYNRLLNNFIVERFGYFFYRNVLYVIDKWNNVLEDLI